MCTFEIHFLINGKYYQELVTAANSYQARQLLQTRYPEAKIQSIRKV